MVVPTLLHRHGNGGQMSVTWLYCKFCGHVMSREQHALANSRACPGRRPGAGWCRAPLDEYVAREPAGKEESSRG